MSNSWNNSNNVNLWHGDFYIEKEKEIVTVEPIDCFMDIELFDINGNLISKDVYKIDLPDTIDKHLTWRYKNNVSTIIPYNSSLIEPSPKLKDIFQYFYAFPSDKTEYTSIVATEDMFRLLLYSHPSFIDPTQQDGTAKGFVSNSDEDTYIKEEEACIGFYFPYSDFESDISQICFGNSLSYSYEYVYETYYLSGSRGGIVFYLYAPRSICVPNNGYIYIIWFWKGSSVSDRFYIVRFPYYDNIIYNYDKEKLVVSDDTETSNARLCSDGQYIYFMHNRLSNSECFVYDFDLNLVKYLKLDNIRLLNIFYFPYLDRICSPLINDGTSIVVFNKEFTGIETIMYSFFDYPFTPLACDGNNVFYGITNNLQAFGDSFGKILDTFKTGYSLVTENLNEDLTIKPKNFYPNIRAFQTTNDIDINGTDIWLSDTSVGQTKISKYRVNVGKHINIRTIHKRRNDSVKIKFRFIYHV